MANYTVKAHPVEALKIVGVMPLIGRNGVLTAPDFGLVLALEDETTQKWLAEKDGAIPSVGAFLVRDSELNVSYIVPASKFSTLFAMTEASHDE